MSSDSLLAVAAFFAGTLLTFCRIGCFNGMSVSFFIYTGLAIEIVALVWLVVIGANVRGERRQARNLHMKMQEAATRYRIRRGWLLVLQLAGIGIMLLGIFMGKS